MQKIIQRFLAVLLLSGSVLNANAGIAHDLSAPTVDLSSELQDYSSADFGRTVTLGPTDLPGFANNLFTDHYTFTTSSTVDFVMLLTSKIAAVESGLTIKAVNLFGAGGFLLVGSQDTIYHSVLDQAWSFDGGPYTLVAGTYTLQVLGYVAASTGGSYSASMAIEAVPEPGTYIMLLAGLVVLGYALRTRSR